MPREIPERIYSPGCYCSGCTSPSECDIGGCEVENEEISAAITANEAEEKGSHQL